MKKTTKLLTVLLALMLLSITMNAQDTGAVRKDDKSSQETKEVKYPEVEGWTRSEPVIYPDKRLGTIVNYQSPIGGRVSLYIYTRGVENIEDGGNSQNVANEMATALEEINKVKDAGYYDSVKVKNKAELVKLGGKEGKVEVLWMMMEIEARGNKLTSETVVFGKNGTFIKLRMTRPEDVEGLENKAVKSLRKAFDDFYSK